MTHSGCSIRYQSDKLGIVLDNDEGLPLLTNALIGNTYDADYDDDENSGDVEEYDGSEYGDDYDDDYDDVNSQLPQVVDGETSDTALLFLSMI